MPFSRRWKATARGASTITRSRPWGGATSSLTAREREVMALVADGAPNKKIATQLGVSEITVKAHRGRVMRKMKFRSLADLVRMADKLRAAREAG